MSAVPGRARHRTDGHVHLGCTRSIATSAARPRSSRTQRAGKLERSRRIRPDTARLVGRVAWSDEAGARHQIIIVIIFGCQRGGGRGAQRAHLGPRCDRLLRERTIRDSRSADQISSRKISSGVTPDARPETSKGRPVSRWRPFSALTCVSRHAYEGPPQVPVSSPYGGQTTPKRRSHEGFGITWMAAASGWLC